MEDADTSNAVSHGDGTTAVMLKSPPDSTTEVHGAGQDHFEVSKIEISPSSIKAHGAGARLDPKNTRGIGVLLATIAVVAIVCCKIKDPALCVLLLVVLGIFVVLHHAFHAVLGLIRDTRPKK